MRMTVTWRPEKHCHGSEEDHCHLETREPLSWMKRELLFSGGSENNYYMGEGQVLAWEGITFLLRGLDSVLPEWAETIVTWKICDHCYLGELRSSTKWMIWEEYHIGVLRSLLPLGAVVMVTWVSWATVAWGNQYCCYLVLWALLWHCEVDVPFCMGSQRTTVNGWTENHCYLGEVVLLSLG